MKILHTGDWHIGKIVNEFSMLEDQAHALEQMIALAREEKPNVIIIAGDIYDRSIPPVEAVALLDRIFNTVLLELQIPILAIAGNHDSAERLSFGSSLLNKNGLYIAGKFDKEPRRVTVEGPHGPVNFYLLPYTDPKELRHILGDEEIASHDIAMQKIIQKIKGDLVAGSINVLVAHGYITNFQEESNEEEGQAVTKAEAVITSDSERPLSIGGTDMINGRHFDCFHYTALGHLHGPQKIGNDRIRYSGSLLKYSFSETNHKKGFTLVNIDADGEVSIDHREISPRRDMRIIKGPLKELIDPATYAETNLQDYIHAILTDQEELVDPISKLRAVYPNIMSLARETNAMREESKTAASAGYKTKSKLALFDEFYRVITGKELDDRRYTVISEVIEAVEREGNR